MTQKRSSTPPLRERARTIVIVVSDAQRRSALVERLRTARQLRVLLAADLRGGEVLAASASPDAIAIAASFSTEGVDAQRRFRAFQGARSFPLVALAASEREAAAARALFDRVILDEDPALADALLAASSSMSGRASSEP